MMAEDTAAPYEVQNVPVTEPAFSVNGNSARRVNAAFAVGLLAAGAFILYREIERWRALEDMSVLGWLSSMDVDATPFAVLFLLLPLFWLPRRELSRVSVRVRDGSRRWLGGGTKPGPDAATRDALRAGLLALLVGAASLGASLSVASRPVVGGGKTFALRELPPVYHDEYSYLQQAKTYLAGRWSYPSHPDQPRLFDTMHVVNDGRFASRYFPATGAWMAPFVAIDRPYWGHWLAGMLTAMFVFAAGRELGGNGVGLTAGLLTGVAPGLALFSNVLLAHHPTLVGLTAFLWLFLRFLRTGRLTCALFAAVGLTFAMLCRPMTAFGFGLPFGAAFGWFLFRGSTGGRRRFNVPALVATAIPILLGFVVLGWQNHAITGDWRKTPYGQFQTKYTPHHVYGFNNVERAEAQIARGEALTDDVFESYSRWAENLTPKRAAENVRSRLLASAQWTLGVVPLLIAGFVFVLVRHSDDRRWWLIAAAFLSLHVAHVPYWLDGNFHWHYVFETAPLMLLLFARSTQVLLQHWRTAARPLLPLWWTALAAVALCTAYTSPAVFWEYSRLDVGVSQFAFTKERYHRFGRLIAERVQEPKALVLVDGDPAEIHFEYVQNPPDLDDSRRVLIGRYRPGRTNLAEVQSAFPDRAVYLVRVRNRRFTIERQPRRGEW